MTIPEAYDRHMRIDLDFSQCESLLAAEHYGHLGCADDNVPYVFPVTYVYKNGYIYSHTAEGAKIDIIRKNPQVCLQVDHVTSGFEWKSVMCLGLYEEITNLDEVYQIHLMLADSYAEISTREGVVPVSPLLTELKKQKVEELKKHVIYRINIKKTTGKAEQPAHGAWERPRSWFSVFALI